MITLNIIRQVYVDPCSIQSFTVNQWNNLIAQGYATKMLARLYYIFSKQSLIKYIPEQALWHFESAYQFQQAHQQDILIELEHVNNAFKMSGSQPIYLKGVAYILADDDASKGRPFSDIDIYVNRNLLSQVERFLKWKGWSMGKVSHYDEKYYRKWMHELPPMTHVSRGSSLDIHHHLLPLTSKYAMSTALIENNIDTDNGVLSPEDRVIHSITHLLLESEFQQGLRDVTDLDMLIKQHKQDNPKFVSKIINRSKEMGVERLTYYALAFLQQYFKTPISQHDLDLISQAKPDKITDWVMKKLWRRVLLSPLNIDTSLSNKFAHFFMYIRGHYLRMPLYLLLPHLMRKAITPLFKQKTV